MTSTAKKREPTLMSMEGVWSDHTEAALLILGSGFILTRQYLRAAKAWQEYGKSRGKKAHLTPLAH